MEKVSMLLIAVRIVFLRLLRLIELLEPQVSIGMT